MLAVTTAREIIGFGGGLTAPELFPVDELGEVLQRVLADHPTTALQYGPSDGLASLREAVVGRLSDRGILCAPEDILITTGAQQALDLLAEAFLLQGSVVLLEAPTYVGALQAFGGHEPDFVAFEMDDEGLVVDRVGDWLEAGRRAAMLYTIPTFQNPTGVTLSRRRREQLLEITGSFRLPIIEDDPYSELSYDTKPPAALRAMRGGEDVIHVGTFSKILAPGMRVGYVIAPAPVRERLVLLKQGRDLHTDVLAQCLIAEYCSLFGLDHHVERLRSAYRARRDAMLAALSDRMPPSVTWTRPAGGMFLWVRLPSETDVRGLLPKALAAGISFVPGTAFHAGGEGANCLRLNFTSSSMDEIEKGIGILGDLLFELLG